MHGDAIDILLVEDNVGDVYLIREAFLLGSLPKRLSVVEDGEQALDYLFRRNRYSSAARPDLVLLDLKLPRIDGHQVLQIVKNHPDLRHIPVLVLSTSDTERDVVNAYEHHANCYLTKPSDLDEYLDLIREIEDYWLSMVCLPA
jgi:two-component system response regulator